MKRHLISAIIAVAAIFGAASASAEFRWGPTAGINITDLDFEQNLLTVDKSVGYGAGVTCEMMFPGIGFGIDFGLSYQQRGATIDLGAKELYRWMGYGRERSYLHYAVIPLHLHFKYTRLNGFEDYLAPFVYVGPSVGFLLAHNKIDCMNYHTAELSIEGGIGAEIMRRWHVSVNYSYGLSNAVSLKVLTDFNAVNTGWSVRVAYLF